jgi:RNA polymerase sigma-70 factor (ECF subfamily)
MRGRARFRGDAEFSTWLRAVALNALRDFLKAKRRRVEDGSLDVESAESAALRRRLLSAPNLGPEIQSVTDAIARLTPRQRHLIEWKYGDGLSYAEIAERLNTTDTAVSQALRRARLALKRAIEAKSDPQP